jgi:hypothetical protein
VKFLESGDDSLRLFRRKSHRFERFLSGQRLRKPFWKENATLLGRLPELGVNLSAASFHRVSARVKVVPAPSLAPRTTLSCDRRAPVTQSTVDQASP